LMDCGCFWSLPLSLNKAQPQPRSIEPVVFLFPVFATLVQQEQGKPLQHRNGVLLRHSGKCNRMKNGEGLCCSPQPRLILLLHR
jgi:hypothetical protein